MDVIFMGGKRACTHYLCLSCKSLQKQGGRGAHNWECGPKTLVRPKKLGQGRHANLTPLKAKKLKKILINSYACKIPQKVQWGRCMHIKGCWYKNLTRSTQKIRAKRACLMSHVCFSTPSHIHIVRLTMILSSLPNKACLISRGLGYSSLLSHDSSRSIA